MANNRDESPDDSDDFDSNDPNEMLQRFLRDFVNGDQDMSQYASAAGLPVDPSMLQAFMAQMQAAMQANSPEEQWDNAHDLAIKQAKGAQVPITAAEHQALIDAFHIAAMWLTQVTSYADVAATGNAINRTEWVNRSFAFWRHIAEPMSASITRAIVTTITDRAPAEFAQAMGQQQAIVERITGTVFAMQLGTIVGQLSQEVITGGEIGVPLFEKPYPAIIAQNLEAFGKDLGIEPQEVQIYMATRELAHSALFNRAKWLGLQIRTLIASYAQDFQLGVEQLDDFAIDFDPSDPSALETAIKDGAFVPPLTERQESALEQLETLLALVEGWVSTVTQAATRNLPKADAITEMMIRRRASGGPAEDAFGALVGLRMRPRQLRAAQHMWQQLRDALGEERADNLWSHPDMLPTMDDIVAPDALIARLTSDTPQSGDAVDAELQRLLNGELSPGPSGIDDEGDGGDAPNDDTPPDENPPQPV